MKYILIFSLFIFGCAQKEELKQQPSKPMISTSDILKVASESQCAKYSFKNSRGVAKPGYIKGMALVYAKNLCNQGSNANKFVSQANTGKTNDVFQHYGLKPKAGIESLRKTYAILIGLGMMETSGKYCGGRDMSANFSSADSAEAGLFQTSYNVISYKSESKALYFSYKADQSKCLVDVFREGVPQSYCDINAKNWGSGEGYNYQALVKKCPALSAETAAVTIRFSGGPSGHYGPLRKKEAEIRPECESMLSQVEKLVLENPDICQDL